MRPLNIDRALEDTDFFSLVYQTTQQIPEGMVSTYGAIARSLGDVIASRAVGRALNLNPRPVIVPCHRVVGGAGDLVGFGLGLKKKKEWLENEGIRFTGDKVSNLGKVLFTEFKVPSVLKDMRAVQERIALLVDTRPIRNKPKYLAAMDVHYPAMEVHADRITGVVEEEARAALVIYDIKHEKITKIHRRTVKIRMPYIPTYLAFRELPPIRSVLKGAKLTDDTVLVLDGNGILHPRGAGSASHCGVVLGIPSIGIAKSQLCGEFDERELKVGCPAKVFIDNTLRGYAVKASMRQKKPVFISPGQGMAPEDALRIIRPFIHYKVPEPIRWAHEAATSESEPVSA